VIVSSSSHGESRIGWISSWPCHGYVISTYPPFCICCDVLAGTWTLMENGVAGVRQETSTGWRCSALVET
jgi:hypothetical protein